MADRIAVMDKGQIEQLGSPMEVYRTPKTEFVAQFIGEANFFYGTVTSLKADDHADIVTRTGLPLDVLNKCDLKEDSAVSISLRPEKLRLSNSKGQTRENAFLGRIFHEVYMGASMRYYVELDSENILFLDQKLGSDEHRHAIGDEVEISWNAEDCLCFPR
jgi:ABC-type Fe3+/spermidine/putrescine transport system ATPase subunit